MPRPSYCQKHFTDNQTECKAHPTQVESDKVIGWTSISTTPATKPVKALQDNL